MVKLTGALAGVGFTEVSAGSKLLQRCSGSFPLGVEMFFYGLINVLMEHSSFHAV